LSRRVPCRSVMEVVVVERRRVAPRGRRPQVRFQPRERVPVEEPVEPVPAVDWLGKWRRIVSPDVTVAEFDKLARGLLNKISVENVGRILCTPEEEEASARELGCLFAGGPAWGVPRFGGLLLRYWLTATTTSRAARAGFAKGDLGVLPGYIRAAGPLLERSPVVLEALLTWVVATLDLDIRTQLEACVLAELPTLPKELQQRCLPYLLPVVPADVLKMTGDPSVLKIEGDCDETKKDVAALMCHFIMFAPGDLRRRLESVGLAVAWVNLVLGGPLQLYIAASLILAVSERTKSARDGSLTQVRSLARAAEELRQEFEKLPRVEFRYLIRIQDAMQSVESLMQSVQPPPPGPDPPGPAQAEAE